MNGMLSTVGLIIAFVVNLNSSILKTIPLGCCKTLCYFRKGSEILNNSSAYILKLTMLSS